MHTNIMKLVLSVSELSKDPSTKVACIITDNDNNEILSTGINEINKYIIKDDFDYINNNKSVKQYVYKHAEKKAIDNLKNKDKKKNLNVYINYPSCLQCTVELLLNNNLNIKNIIYIDRGSDSFRERYKISDALNLMHFKNVNVIPLSISDFKEF